VKLDKKKINMLSSVTSCLPLTARRISAINGRSFVRQFASASAETVNIKLSEGSFKAYKCDPPSLEFEATKEELIRMYKEMVTTRRMEVVADSLYKAKKIRGFCHLCTGQVSLELK
jgi:pyruvate dehydrogenase E1 component alpha subunit